ncbi:flavodoxin family protein [Acetobacterium woodii]|uniref:NADPH-dependent FMN reductase n=1 Tax=Acetobacterium woodii (strain ATCC 29683 / DSM 1030 / JCM 2381 / KCTC 1655 / WB1) TaxID=931626 RepID=H6LBR8_ACEWD|nr:flavodoxin family protein [Acetobacterium woodii]AFA50191.1 NADPH-dependent FMN reductase [Acetobacterium woodii DSM 1030]
MSKIVVLIGSPRKNGNTAILANSFIDGVDKQKNSVEVISVIGKKVNGCIGCDFCYKDSEHNCVQKDDMQEIYENLADADVIVIATPIYFYGISSQLKCIIDRLHNPIRNTFKVKELVLLAVCADTIPIVFDSVQTMYNSVLSYFSLRNAGVITVPGVSNKGDIIGNPALTEARKLGESF